MNASEGAPILSPPSNAAVDADAPPPIAASGIHNLFVAGDDGSCSLERSNSSCLTRLLPPLITFFPPMGIRLTVFVSDGSNLTAVPEQILRRL